MSNCCWFLIVIWSQFSYFFWSLFCSVFNIQHNKQLLPSDPYQYLPDTFRTNFCVLCLPATSFLQFIQIVSTQQILFILSICLPECLSLTAFHSCRLCWFHFIFTVPVPGLAPLSQPPALSFRVFISRSIVRPDPSGAFAFAAFVSVACFVAIKKMFTVCSQR